MPLDQLPVPEDAPLRLAEAAKIAFPDGSISASGLRREASKGRLTIERVAGKDFTTLQDIKRMRELSNACWQSSSISLYAACPVF
jgi:hypothetical protein